MADGHLGLAQMANARRVSHLGLGSNFQPSPKCPTAYPKVFCKVKLTQTSWLYTCAMHHVCTLCAHAVSFSITH